MPSYFESVTIDASPEKVWAILSSLEDWPEWTPSVTKIERIDQGALRVGSSARVYQPKLRPAIWEITDWRPNEAFTWVSTSLGTKVTAEHFLERIENGCRLKLGIHFQGVLGALIGVLASGLTRKYLNLEANGLKHQSEFSEGGLAK